MFIIDIFFDFCLTNFCYIYENIIKPIKKGAEMLNNIIKLSVMVTAVLLTGCGGTVKNNTNSFAPDSTIASAPEVEKLLNDKEMMASKADKNTSKEGMVSSATVSIKGKVNTPDYWKCTHKSFGSWGTFGRLPVGCDVDPFGDPEYVKSEFSTLIFNDFEERHEEERRYTDTMVHIIKDAAIYYLHSRKPSASQEEIDAWVRAALAMGHQESYMSHYRKAKDGRIKMLRGDFGHGHGMMQVDDRWHFAALQEGKGWQIFGNMMYSFEEYYEAWKRAPRAWCVPSDTSDSEHFYKRTRAAYSVYNGGPSKVCRWTRPNDRWARNDKNYKAKLDNQSWERKVDDMEASSPLNVPCYMEGNEHCSNDSTQGSWDNRLLKLNSGEFCFSKDNAFVCIEESRDALCLATKEGINIEGGMLTLSAADSASYPKLMNDRDICHTYIEGVYKVGETIKLERNINLRTTPGGALISTLQKNDTYQILDFEVKEKNSNKRYYRVESSAGIGYVYAGDKNSYAAWTKRSSDAPIKKIIPQVNDMIKIMVSGAINIRQTPGGTRVGSIPSAAKTKVLESVVKGKQNSLYYKIAYNDVVGYIYGGDLMPANTLHKWAEITTAEAPVIVPVVKQLKNAEWWTHLRGSADASGDVVDYVIGQQIDEYCTSTGNCDWTIDSFVVLEENASWSKIRLDRDALVGWIKSELIK